MSNLVSEHIEKAFVTGLEGALQMAQNSSSLHELIAELEQWIEERKS